MSHPIFLRLFATLSVLIIASSATAQELQLTDLEKRLKTLTESHEGQVSLLVRHLNSGREISIAPDQVMPTASLIKVAVLVTAYREADAGRLDLEKKVELLHLRLQLPLEAATDPTPRLKSF